MLLKKNKSIFTDFVQMNNLRFNYIDIGARGDIVSPWLEIEKDSLIIGFEPDPSEAMRLNATHENRKYYDISLWSAPTSKTIYINEWESTSSMYLPNIDFLSGYQLQHHKGRKPKKEFHVKCDTLDNILLEDEVIPDFIKVDTQGAELEILKGSERILKEYSPIVTCETWCAEVYKDAPLMHEVIGYMDSLGYQVFDMELAAAWRHGVKAISSKAKSIGYEILFVKTKDLNTKNKKQVLKFMLLLELYGYRDYAIFLMSSIENDFNELKILMCKNSQNEQKLFTKIINTIVNQINKVLNFNFKVYPSIKY
jgi:FkbM family methyltransferase